MEARSLQPRLAGRIAAFFAFLAHQGIRHPRLVLVVAAFVTLAAAPGLLRLKLRTDGHALVSPDALEVRLDNSIRQRFGIEDQIVVLIQPDHPDGIYNPGTLQLVRELTSAFRGMPSINPSNVVSLATEPSMRWRPGTLLRQTLLETPMTTQAELDQLRDELQQIQLYTGTLVSADGKATVILLGVPSGSDRVQLYEQVLQILAARPPVTDDIAVTGAPVAEALLGIHILEDLGVPAVLLGTSTRSHTERLDWRMPANFYELRLLVAQRVGLVPVAMLVMVLIFLVTFRNLLATMLPLLEVAAVLVFAFGLMGWVGVPVYLTTAVMPVLLTAMCVTDEIHLFARYFALLREKREVNHVDLVRRTMDELASPVASTTLTTAIGFISFALSPLRPVQAFGIFTALGVLFSLLCSLMVIPAMLTLIRPAWLVPRRRQSTRHPGALADGFARLALLVVRQRRWIVGLVVIILALVPFGLRRLVIQDSWIDGFDPNSEFRRATQLVNDQFYGMHLLFVSVDQPQKLRGKILASAISRGGIVVPGGLVEHPTLIAGSAITISLGGGASNAPPPRVVHSRIEMVYGLGTNIGAQIPSRDAPPGFFEDFSRTGQADFEVVVHTQLRPEMIHILADLAAFIRERRQFAVGGVLGPCEYLETTRFMTRTTDPNSRILPDDPAEIKLMWDYYGLARGQARLHQIVDTNYWQSLTAVFLKNANFIDTARLLNDLRAYERDHLAPKGIKLDFAGDVAVSQSLIKSIVTTQLRSLIWSLVGIYALTTIFGRSLRWGLYCVLPSTLAVVINFAVLGWFGIPLGVATSMFAGMTLGIGVDFAIHVLEGCGLARASGATQTEALTSSMALTGPPVLVNTLAISLGFGVLMLSQVPANARLGLLTTLGLVDCLIASLLLLPVLLHWWPLRKAWEDPARAGKSPSQPS